MGERKLNLNAPLMSVRRFSSPSSPEDRRNKKIIENPLPNSRLALPLHRSDFELDQVTEPVAVPFKWEQIPGRVKDGIGPAPQPLEEASATPRLPPGRFLDLPKQPPEKESEDTNRFSFKTEAYSSNDNVLKLEYSKEGVNEKGGSDSEDGNDVYSDALDTLSPTDSFSMNYCASGVSGSSVPGVKPSGTFSTDPQTRDFMMSRFLPAARAMALEPHRYASRKQDVPPEQPRQVERVASEDRRPLLKQSKSDLLPLYDQNKDVEESEDEDEEDDYENSGNISAKGCGLFPSLCFKNSLCLLSPVPGIRDRTQAPVSSIRDARRPGKAAYIRSHTQIAQKHTGGAVHNSKLNYGVKSAELVKIDRKQNGEFSRFTRSGELQTTGKLIPYSGSPRAGVSPYRNKAPQSPFHGVSFLGVPKKVEDIKANRFNPYVEGTKKNKQGSGSTSPAVEKTLYVDTVNTEEILFASSRSLETKGFIDSAREDLDTSQESKGLEETTNAESFFQDLRCLNISTEGGVMESSVSIDANLSSMSEISHLKGQDVMMVGSGQDRGLGIRTRSLECSKVVTEGNRNINGDHIHEVDDPGNADSSSLKNPAPPPLPKSPSESWLWRTLPSISSRNLFSHSNLGTPVHPKKHAPRRSSTSSKWETIVKTSHSHHDHVRYSEELVTHVSQQSKTQI